MQKQDEMSAPRFRRYSVSVFGWVSGTKEAVCDLNGLGRCSSAGLFMLTSALCGLAAALVFGYLRAAAPTTGAGSEFRVMGARSRRGHSFDWRPRCFSAIPRTSA
jgi:hypothetical protein